MEKLKYLLNNIKTKNTGNLFIIVGILIITTLEWHFYDWYQACTKYGTLITFIALAGAFLCYVDIKDAFKDKLFYVVVITVLIALINLFLIGSNKGSILIVADIMLILYLSDKMKFSKRQTYFVLVYVAFFFIYWTIDVKGYFKGYNTNYGGLILITGFAFLMVLMQVFLDKITDRYEKYIDEVGKADAKKIILKKYFWFSVLYVFFIVVAFSIISWYRSRTALMGLIALLAIMLIPRKILSNKVVYTCISFLATFGAVAFAGLYIFLGSLSDGDGIQLFYKSIISGRNEIWSELLSEFMKHPLTGIGSSYEMKLDYMAGMIEAHSAMIDILVVHGLLVFIPVCVFLLMRVINIGKNIKNSNLNKIIFAAMICMLVTGFFENYYIVQPFSLILLSLFMIPTDTTNTNCR